MSEPQQLLQNAQAEPDPSATIAESRAAAAHALYGDPTITHRESGNEIKAAGAHAMWTTEQQEAEKTAVTQILGRVTTNPVDGRAMADTLAQFIRKVPSVEQTNEWAEQSKAYLRETYGDRAGEVLQKTKAMVKADPALASRLKNGAGNHPDVIRILAKKAHGR